MMREKFIHHITLTTAHSRKSYRNEVGDDAVAACRNLIDKIAVGEVSEPAKIPGVGDYYLSGRATSKCMVATVMSGAPSVVIATIGVALHSQCGARLWRELHTWGETPVVTDPNQCPPEPWVAAALDVGIAQHMEAAHWLADFERVLAWAFLERQRG